MINRRHFLASSLAAATYLATPRGAHAAIRIPGATTLLDLHKRFDKRIEIAAVEQLQIKDDIFIRARSADGAVGVCPGNNRLKVTVEMARQLVVPFFVGKDARDIESLVDDVYSVRDDRGSVYKFAGMPFWNIVGHVEIAIFDMLGNIAGVPVCELLGGKKRDAVDVYISQFGRNTTAEQEVANAVKDLRKTGAKATKLKVGLRMDNSREQMRRDKKMIELAREKLGDGVTIVVDSNSSYTVGEAIEMGRHFEQYNVGFFEEPVPWQDYEGTRAVTDALEMTVAGGEQDSSLWTWEDMVERRVVDLPQPDVFYNGGLVRCLRVAKMAELKGMQVTPHSPKVLPDAAANLHFCAAVANLGPFQEYRAYGKVDNGKVAIPTGPGLGNTYDEKMWQNAKVL